MIDDYTSEIGALAGQRSSIAKVFVNDLDHNFGIYVELAYDVAYGCLRLNERTEDKFLLRQEIQTESFYILGLLLTSAAKHCEAEQYKPDTLEARNSFLSVEDFHAGLSGITNYDSDYDTDEKSEEINYSTIRKSHSLRFPLSGNEYHIDDYLSRHKLPSRDSKELESFVADYLGSIFRSPELDSFMFKLLAEEEPLQFISEMAYDHTQVLKNVPLIEKPKLEKAKEYMNNMSKIGFFGATKGFFMYTLYSVVLIAGSYWIDNEWIILLALFLSLGLYAFWVWAIVAMALEKRSLRKDRARNPHARTIDLVNVMKDFFCMMRSSGKISLDRVDQKLKALETEGAVMPETLHVFLSDMKSKGITSI